MIVALINWRIIPSEVDAFLKKWKTELSLGNAQGLIGEFLSKVEDENHFSGVTWVMEPDERDDKSTWLTNDYVSYVNVGLWASVRDFETAVGDYMSPGRAITQPFEAAPRRRAILTPQHWRRGPMNLPGQTSKGVIP